MKRLATTLVLLAGTAAAQNLLVNPDAEIGTINGWTDPDNAWAAAAESTPHSGSYHFWPKLRDLPQTTMRQDVDVSASAAARGSPSRRSRIPAPDSMTGRRRRRRWP